MDIDNMFNSILVVSAGFMILFFVYMCLIVIGVV
jgi:hypothetical protein